MSDTYIHPACRYNFHKSCTRLASNGKDTMFCNCDCHKPDEALVAA